MLSASLNKTFVSLSLLKKKKGHHSAFCVAIPFIFDTKHNHQKLDDILMNGPRVSFGDVVRKLSDF